MKGLLAKFSDLRLPASESGKKITTDLTVITSLGSDTARDAVTIYPKKKAEKKTDPGKATLYTTLVIQPTGSQAKPRVLARVEEELYPKGKDLLLQVRPVGGKAWDTVGAIPRESKDGSAVVLDFEWNLSWKTEIFGPPKSTAMEVNLAARERSQSVPESLFLKGKMEQRLAYFLSGDQANAKFAASPSVLNFSGGKFTDDLTLTANVGENDLFFVAYPGLKKDLEKKTGFLVYEESGAKVKKKLPFASLSKAEVADKGKKLRLVLGKDRLLGYSDLQPGPGKTLTVTLSVEFDRAAGNTEGLVEGGSVSFRQP